jgi:signal transduction histidine kinase
MLRALKIPVILTCLQVMSAGEVLTSSAELRAMTPTRLAEKLPVRISGVVTSVRGKDYREFILQDRTGGMVASLDDVVGDKLVAGRQVEIEGVTAEETPSPRVKVRKLTVGPVVGLPQPMKVSPLELRDGSKDANYVEFQGVIRAAKIEEGVPPTRLVLDFGPEGRRLQVWVSHFNEEERARLRPDVEVRVRGVCNSWRSPNFQPFSTFVTVSDPQEIEVLKEAPQDWEKMRKLPLQELLVLPVDDFMAHREVAGGVVTLCWPDGQVVLQRGGHAIRLRMDGPGGLRLGDRVVAAGFPSLAGGMVVLENAEVKRTGAAGLVEPEEISPQRLLDESGVTDREARLLRMAGRFKETLREGGLQMLVIAEEKRDFRAILPEGEVLPDGLEPGVEVVVEGVCRMGFSDVAGRFGKGADVFDLQLPDARAIKIGGNRSWLTVGGVLMALGPVLLGTFLWVLVLRRRVGKRSDLLVREIRARHDAELVAAERVRLAADLHDTISQSLSGAAMQLEVAGSLAEEGISAEDHLALAKRLLDRGREDLRRTVWDLSPSALADVDLASALEQVVRESGTGCEVHVSRSGDIASLPERIRIHLFRSGQEALANSLRHGGARRVGISVGVAGGEVGLEIVDDGCGFDPATVPGPDEGHFGLRSLKERITRLGGTLEVASTPAGTRIIATVPLES